jgi:hypothetical protein
VVGFKPISVSQSSLLLYRFLSSLTQHVVTFRLVKIMFQVIKFLFSEVLFCILKIEDLDPDIGLCTDKLT